MAATLNDPSGILPNSGASVPVNAPASSGAETTQPAAAAATPDVAATTAASAAAPTSTSERGEDAKNASKNSSSSRPPKRYLTISPPLSASEIPQHPDLGHASPTGDEAGTTKGKATSNPPLQAFLKHMFSEVRSQAFTQQSFKKTGSHSFPAKSQAHGTSVEQSAQDISGETWFARCSTHVREPDKLRSWEVFDAVVRADHSKHEGEYTPNIYGTNTVLEWQVRGAEAAELDVRDLSVHVTNMYHGIPAPLNDRVFSVFVVSGVWSRAAVAGDADGGVPGKEKDEGFVIQIPMDTMSLPEIVKARCHHNAKGANLVYEPPAEAVTDANRSKAGKKLVQGVYASVETLAREENGDTTWFMATTSDAKGVLPGWVQKKAVPGEIVKDVEYVYGYIDKHKEELMGLMGN